HALLLFVGVVIVSAAIVLLARGAGLGVVCFLYPESGQRVEDGGPAPGIGAVFEELVDNGFLLLEIALAFFDVAVEVVLRQRRADVGEDGEALILVLGEAVVEKVVAGGFGELGEQLE